MKQDLNTNAYSTEQVCIPSLPSMAEAGLELQWKKWAGGVDKARAVKVEATVWGNKAVRGQKMSGAD